MKNTWVGHLASSVLASAITLPVMSAAWADVTIEQKTTLNFGSVIRMHGATTTSTTADKKRDDTETHCEGMMSMFCGNLQSGDIVRLDRDLTWHLQPKKKLYREDMFATPEELAQMRAKMQANLEKMRSCPVSKQEQTVDKSKCEMSPPKIDVHKTDEKLSIAGHDAQRTVATFTETCTNKQTGDVCDTVVAMDLWLTQDKLPGVDDRRVFAQAYAKKLGLDDAQGALRSEYARFLGPYQAQIKQLTDKSSDLKGQPLKTSLRVLMGGPHCSAKSDSGAANGDASANPMGDVAQTGKALGKLMGGMFGKKKTDDAPPPEPASTTPDPYAQLTQLAAFSMETVSINADAIPAARFDVPPDWKKEVPKPGKETPDDYTCPKTGG